MESTAFSIFTSMRQFLDKHEVCTKCLKPHKGPNWNEFLSSPWHVENQMFPHVSKKNARDFCD